jgi:PTH1 family peptidyl-tRNA hydrolase
LDQLRRMTRGIVGPNQSRSQTETEPNDDDGRGYLIVGLGNPGRRFDNTRHNAGGMAVDRLARKYGIELKTRRANAHVGDGMIDGSEVTLALPQTFMNTSGESVGPLVRRTNTPTRKLLIVYDDLDLPLGKTRLRPEGSSGGHNGMRSVIAAIKTDDFPRLRVGIGRPESAGRNTIEHVIGRFLPDEETRLTEALDRTVECIESMVIEGFERAMNRFN